ncbi:MAG: hypothetical protein ACK5MG_06710 [Bacteroidales bacterium]
MRKSKGIYIVILTVVILTCCSGESYVPKPNGYYRFDLPKKSYHRSKENLPYSFNIADYSSLEIDRDKNAEPYWRNVVTKTTDINAKIHLSYMKIDGNIDQYIEDAYKLAFKHTIKANNIENNLIYDTARNIYGVYYNIDGNAASPFQFFITDSTKHFLRGSIYVWSTPNIDSLQPIYDFMTEDAIEIINSIEWDSSKK